MIFVLLWYYKVFISVKWNIANYYSFKEKMILPITKVFKKLITKMIKNLNTDLKIFLLIIKLRCTSWLSEY